MKKIRCKVCGTRFPATKDAMYIAAEKTTVVSALTTPTKSFECFDCPKCGCQSAVNVRLTAVTPGKESCDNDG